MYSEFAYVIFMLHNIVFCY